MLKRYIVRTECEALFLDRSIDHDSLDTFLLAIPHSITDKGVSIMTPNGEDLIPFDKFYLLFDVGSNQLLSVEKAAFEKNATEIKEGVHNVQQIKH